MLRTQKRQVPHNTVLSLFSPYSNFPLGYQPRVKSKHSSVIDTGPSKGREELDTKGGNNMYWQEAHLLQNKFIASFISHNILKNHIW